eukprot:2713337-Rhodomonas_salina.3
MPKPGRSTPKVTTRSYSRMRSLNTRTQVSALESFGCVDATVPSSSTRTTRFVSSRNRSLGSAWQWHPLPRQCLTDIAHDAALAT